jgi:hypothetical protein
MNLFTISAILINFLPTRGKNEGTSIPSHAPFIGWASSGEIFRNLTKQTNLPETRKKTAHWYSLSAIIFVVWILKISCITQNQMSLQPQKCVIITSFFCLCFKYTLCKTLTCVTINSPKCVVNMLPINKLLTNYTYNLPIYNTILFMLYIYNLLNLTAADKTNLI